MQPPNGACIEAVSGEQPETPQVPTRSSKATPAGQLVQGQALRFRSSTTASAMPRATPTGPGRRNNREAATLTPAARPTPIAISTNDTQHLHGVGANVVEAQHADNKRIRRHLIRDQREAASSSSEGRSRRQIGQEEEKEKDERHDCNPAEQRQALGRERLALADRRQRDDHRGDAQDCRRREGDVHLRQERETKTESSRRSGRSSAVRESTGPWPAPSRPGGACRAWTRAWTSVM